MMRRTLAQAVADFAEEHRLFDATDGVVLAVSGGADSTALLHLMCRQRNAGQFGARMVCAHINHQLRGREADGDEEFVRELCAKVGVPFAARRIDVRTFARENKLSIETAARNLRLNALAEISRENGCSCIATAHQKDDNAETIIQRLARGTGYRGLAGIRPAGTFAGMRIVRPLLGVTRQEIEDYLRASGIEWRTDKTNDDVVFRRNFIRHRLIPAIQRQCNERVSTLLGDLALAASGFIDLVDRATDSAWPATAETANGEASLRLDRFAGQPRPVEIELIRRAMLCLAGSEGDITEWHYRRVLKLATSKSTGKTIHLAGGLAAAYEDGKLVFRKAPAPGESAAGASPPPQPPDSAKIRVPGTTEFEGFRIEAAVIEAGRADIEDFKTAKSNSVEWFDADAVESPLQVRFRRQGDRFQPLGQRAEKKVGKFLTTAKIARHRRRSILIIEDKKRVIWVAPVRISDQTKVRQTTRRILELKLRVPDAAKTL